MAGALPVVLYMFRASEVRGACTVFSSKALPAAMLEEVTTSPLCRSRLKHTKRLKTSSPAFQPAVLFKQSDPSEE